MHQMDFETLTPFTAQFSRNGRFLWHGNTHYGKSQEVHMEGP